MNLNEKYEAVTWPAIHYVYVEKIGPFQLNAPQAWEEFHQYMPKLSQDHKLKNGFSLYRVESQVYRAGFSLEDMPSDLPDGLEYTRFEGGKYIRFVLTGPYSQLPDACGRVFEIVRAQNIETDDHDRFYIENYVTDPATTPEDQLITEILVPVF